MTSPYDAFAWFYHRHWAKEFLPWAVEVLDRVLCPEVPAPARILDVCCGTGAIARHLTERGYTVTGLDASLEQVRCAMPGAFFVADAGRFATRPVFDAAISTFDSLNHILDGEQLGAAFRNVNGSLRPGGVFVFDMNLESAYGPTWDDTAMTLDEEHACFLRGKYDPATRLGSTLVTLFRKEEEWRRYDAEVRQRWYPEEELHGMLARAGFAKVEQFDPLRDLGVRGAFGPGRAVFRAWK